MKYFIVVMLVVLLCVGCSNVTAQASEYEVYDDVGHSIVSLANSEDGQKDRAEVFYNLTDNDYTKRGLTIGSSIGQLFEAYKGETAIANSDMLISFKDFDEFKDGFTLHGYSLMFGTIYTDKGPLTLSACVKEMGLEEVYKYVEDNGFAMNYIYYEVEDDTVQSIEIAYLKYPKQGEEDDYAANTESSNPESTQVRAEKVANLIGWSLTDAQQWAEENGLQIKIEKEYNDSFEVNRVISQDIQPDSRMPEVGSYLTITVSLGHDESTFVDLPDFMFMTMVEIQSWASEKYMTNIRMTTEYSDTVLTGDVIRFEINDTITGNQVRRDAQITVIISKGPET